MTANGSIGQDQATLVGKPVFRHQLNAHLVGAARQDLGEGLVDHGHGLEFRVDAEIACRGWSGRASPSLIDRANAAHHGRLAAPVSTAGSDWRASGSRCRCRRRCFRSTFFFSTLLQIVDRADAELAQLLLRGLVDVDVVDLEIAACLGHLAWSRAPADR